MKKFSLILISLLFLSMNNYAAEVKFSSALIKTPRPGLNITSGFFSLLSDHDLLIKSIQADLIGRIEIHTMAMKKTADGLEIMQMRKMESPKISKGVPFVLRPGSDHLMLYEVNSQISSTKKITLKFTFESNTGDLLTQNVVFDIN